MLQFSITKLSNSIRTAGLGRYALAAVLAIGMVCCTAGRVAQAQQMTSGSSGRQFKEEGIEAVPFTRLNEDTQAKLKPVLEKPSIYRRLPKMAIECDQDYYRFLIRHPEVIVEIWKLMGVTKMDTTRTGPFQLQSDDGAGTLSDLELVYGDGQKHIYYGTGTYEGALLRRKLSGRCVLVLQTQHVTDDNGKPKAISQLDVYLKVDNVAAGAIARTLQPLVGPTADHNFIESLKFIKRLHDTTVRNGPGVQMMGNQLDIQPDVLKGFQQVAGLAYERGNATTAPTETGRRATAGPQVRSFSSSAAPDAARRASSSPQVRSFQSR